MELSEEDVLRRDLVRIGFFNRVRSSRLKDSLWRAWTVALSVWVEGGLES